MLIVGCCAERIAKLYRNSTMMIIGILSACHVRCSRGERVESTESKHFPGQVTKPGFDLNCNQHHMNRFFFPCVVQSCNKSPTEAEGYWTRF